MRNSSDEPEIEMRDVSRFCAAMLIAAIGLLISSRAAWAELPPSAYANMKDNAGEALRIEVLKVDGLARRGPNEESYFTVTAKVVCMARSASGLTPGATITIGYATVLQRPRGWAGPGRVGILEPRVYAAYLNKSGAIYAPAAGGQSFIASRPGMEPSPAGKPC
jgi:hypothetical protein